jgi:hypothetical protein
MVGRCSLPRPRVDALDSFNRARRTWKVCLSGRRHSAEASTPSDPGLVALLWRAGQLKQERARASVGHDCAGNWIHYGPPAGGNQSSRLTIDAEQLGRVTLVIAACDR